MCVSVYRCIYPGGDLNMNTHRLMGTRVTVVQELLNQTRIIFFDTVKVHKVSCEG